MPEPASSARAGPVDVVRVTGSPRVCGHAHGEHHRASIAAALERVASALRDADTDLVERGLRSMVEHVPTMAEELAGIAEGANVDLPGLAILNGVTSSVVPEPAAGAALDLVDAGGTSIYGSGPEGPMLGHVLDMPRCWASPVFALDVPIGRGTASSDHRALVLTTPGVLGLLGVNGHGLAVTSLGLHTGAGLGVPFAALTRTLLERSSADAALASLRAIPRARGRYWVATDGADFVGAECSVGRVVQTQRGAKAAHLHTNHCFDPVLRIDEAVPRASTSFSRINVASTVYAQRRPRSPDALWSLLNAHADGPLGTLCRHPRRGGGDDEGMTAAIAVLQPRTRTMRVVAGCDRRGAPRTMVVPTC